MAESLDGAGHEQPPLGTTVTVGEDGSHVRSGPVEHVELVLVDGRPVTVRVSARLERDR